MGLRLLVLVIVVALLVWLVRRALGRRAPTEPTAPPERGGQMLRCAHCGLHVPAREAVMAEGTPYCSDAHRLAGPRD